MNKLYSLKNISVIYGKGDTKVDALSNISLDIKEGETIAIVGPSGSGKSTLLNVLGGLEKIKSGELLYKDKSMYQRSANSLADLRLQEFGFVFQAFYLISSMSVFDNIVLPAKVAYGKFDKNWLEQLIQKLNIEHRMQHFPGELSGGEKQRVAIARALINNPSILFADEPSGNLDSKNGDAVFQLLFEYAKEYKKTLIYVTHDKEKASLAGRQIMIKDGMIEK